MPNTESITVKAADHIFHLFKESLPEGYVYHNYSHTLDVVNAARKIGAAMKLSADELEIVELGCWFHDAGYTEKWHQHEERSAAHAAEFLRSHGYDEERIEAVRRCILSTCMPQAPATLLEEIICDSDLLHLGKKTYFEKSALLRVELEKTENKVFSDYEWMKYNLDFLTSHKFHTSYAQKKFEERKTANLVKLQEEFRELLEETEKRQTKSAMINERMAQKEARARQPERGIETMFRVTLRNHISLSAIADSKANTMLSINALIISIVVSVVLSQLEHFPVLGIPLAVLLIVCILTITFATIATRPQVTSGKVTKIMIKERKANLLFFGNFHDMALEDFEWGMNELLNDRDYLYGSMIKDFYYLGKVLGKKYKYLRLCYNVFMYGMIVSVLLFLVFSIIIHYRVTL